MGLTKSTNLLPLLRSLLVVLILESLFVEFCNCTDTITSTQFIKDPDSVASSGTSTFKLGFFSPINTTNRYVGILYRKVPVTTAIWVANRDEPLRNSLGIVTISEDGNLVVLDGRKEVIWSSNFTNSISVNSSAQLLETGNLVLKDNFGRILWESFQHPTDSVVGTMKSIPNVNTGHKNLMTSWKSPSDPSIGIFSVSVDFRNIPQAIVWNGSQVYWRSGPWDGQNFIGIAKPRDSLSNRVALLDDREGNAHFSLTSDTESVVTYCVVNFDGSLVHRFWRDGMEDWGVSRLIPENECDVYGKCGPFGSCNWEDTPICSCLKGFEPKNMEEWSRGNWTSGCARRTQLQCDRKSAIKSDGFIRFTTMKVPEFSEWTNAIVDACISQCLDNCSCIAYAYYTGIGCMHWSGSLIDIQINSAREGTDLFIRVAYSELDKKVNMKAVIIPITVSLGSIAIAVCTYVLWKLMSRRKGMKSKSEMSFIKSNELPLFSFKEVANATKNFDTTNKLGQGGFGPVYKGKLSDGQEIAVKRHSRSSRQGLEEFKNEVVVVSKLQHRNLVRLLGGCIEGDEKMLIYDYMPNGSLDSFLFDQLESKHLDWGKRANIIEGIGRGLLYLHRDSRLKIIHRDLKPSNILLDKDLNAKISDFGMARIFGGNQDQANTRRVVGTYGYMAPEYAVRGRFSEKSDVFSFGVLLLEILSGKMNSNFHDHEDAASLLAFAWGLWNEGKIVELIDPRISNPYFQTEMLRYIHVGLLCVEYLPRDRPTVSTILSMLSSEIANLPPPKQPAFAERQITSETEEYKQVQERYSLNNVTLSIVEAR